MESVRLHGCHSRGGARQVEGKQWNRAREWSRPKPSPERKAGAPESAQATMQECKTDVIMVHTKTSIGHEGESAFQVMPCRAPAASQRPVIPPRPKNRPSITAVPVHPEPRTQERAIVQEEQATSEDLSATPPLESSLEELDLTCPICFELLGQGGEQAICRCAWCLNNFCKPCLADALSRSSQACPMCRNVLERVERNHELEQRIARETSTCETCGLAVSIRALEAHQATCGIGAVATPPLPSQGSKNSYQNPSEAAQTSGPPDALPLRPSAVRRATVASGTDSARAPSTRPPCQPPPPTHWECKRCTFHNQVGSQECEMCSAASPVGNGATSAVPESTSRPLAEQPRRASEPVGGISPAPPQHGHVPAAQPVTSETKLMRFDFLPVAELSDAECGVFHGYALLRTSSKVVFRKWKTVLVTLRGTRLLFHDTRLAGRSSLSEKNALKAFTLDETVYLRGTTTVLDSVVDKQPYKPLGGTIRTVTPPVTIYRAGLHGVETKHHHSAKEPKLEIGSVSGGNFLAIRQEIERAIRSCRNPWTNE